MKVRTTIAGTAFRVKLTAVCWGALTLLAPVAVSACSGSSSTPNVPTFTPSVTISGTITRTATAPASDGTTPASGATATTTASATVTPIATVTETVTAPATSSTSYVPPAAPVTGGGGTAGLQDGLLFLLGAAAILAGAGSIVYHMWLTRRR